MSQEVTHQINIYEVNGERSDWNHPKLIVESHPVSHDSIRLTFGDNNTIVVVARDLRKAIDNCTNTTR